MIKLYPTNKTSFISSGEIFRNFGKISQMYVSNLTGGFFDTNSEKRSLVYFDVDEFIENIDFVNDKVELILHLSLFDVVNENYEIFVHPLTKAFEEGFSTELYSGSGVSWINSSSGESWGNWGGDFNDQISFPVTFDKKNNIMRVDITSFLEDVYNETYDNFGLIFVPNEHIRNVGIYSNSDYSNLGPRVYVQTEQRQLITDSENEYDSSDYISDPILRVIDYKPLINVGETTSHILNIEPRFVRKRTFIESKYIYSENVKYQIFDVSRNKIVVPFSDYTKTDVINSIIVNRLDFSNYPDGLYEVTYKMEEDRVVYSEPINIRVEQKYE